MKFKRISWQIIKEKDDRKKHIGYKIRSYYKSDSGERLTLTSKYIHLGELPSNDKEIYWGKKKIFGLNLPINKCAKYTHELRNALREKNKEMLDLKIINLGDNMSNDDMRGECNSEATR